MSTAEVDPPTDEELLNQYSRELCNTILPVTILFGVEIVFGILGNLLTMYVFFFRYKPCNFRYFVLGLALNDFISCLTTIPAEMVSQIYWYTYPVPPICKIKAYFNQFTVCCEAACLMIIAVDRYRKVCQPFGWQIKQHVAMYFCIGIYVVAGILAIPTPIFWGVHTESALYEGRNITVTVCEKDGKYKDTKFPLANIAFNQSLVCLGLVCMFVLYILVTKKLIIGHTELKRRQSLTPKLAAASTIESSMDKTLSDSETEMTGNVSCNPESGIGMDIGKCLITVEESRNPDRKKGKDELSRMVRVRRKTMIMLILTIIFIVTTIMYGILLSVVAFGILRTLVGPEKVIYFFFLRLYFINHVINPVLYGLIDPQFRIEMLRVKAKLLQTCHLCSGSARN